MGLAKTKDEAPVNKFVIYFKQSTCNHCKEVHLELRLWLIENQ